MRLRRMGKNRITRILSGARRATRGSHRRDHYSHSQPCSSRYATRARPQVLGDLVSRTPLRLRRTPPRLRRAQTAPGPHNPGAAPAPRRRGPAPREMRTRLPGAFSKNRDFVHTQLDDARMSTFIGQSCKIPTRFAPDIPPLMTAGTKQLLLKTQIHDFGPSLFRLSTVFERETGPRQAVGQEHFF